MLSLSIFTVSTETINTKQAAVLVLRSLKVCGYVHASVCTHVCTSVCVCVCVLKGREHGVMSSTTGMLYSVLRTLRGLLYAGHRHDSMTLQRESTTEQEKGHKKEAKKDMCSGLSHSPSMRGDTATLAKTQKGTHLLLTTLIFSAHQTQG